MSAKMSYDAFVKANDKLFTIGTDGVGLESNVYRGFGMETMMKPGHNVSFWQTRLNVKHLAKYVYITKLRNLINCGEVRRDLMEYDQGGDKGIAIAVFHKKPLSAGLFQKVEIMLGQTRAGDKVVNMDNVRKYLQRVQVAPMNYPNWTDLNGKVHFADETPSHVGIIVGSAGMFN